MMSNVAMNSQTNTQVDSINHSVDTLDEDMPSIDDVFNNPTTVVDIPDYTDDPTEFEL
jgi:hypothetical protein